ncbi:CST complex subunit STN1-like [Prosopis cineraria]|uniref:CST complex subunit STN1-like n=1 Tax=Prosopis cineraria TaxID=364024 RepID=UPI00240F0CD9|nr:CST complex subunit STN1-like [Prosopis cineraria]
MQQHGPLFNSHVKLLAFDLLSLAQTPSSSNSSLSFSRRGIPLSRTEAVGTVTSRELKPHRFLKFTLDDGTGCINCILWLNHFSSPSDAALIAAAAAAFADLVQLGKVARVRGQITSFRGALQITVSDVVIERDPNAEIFHWLDCLNLARKCYDVLPSPPSKPN